LGGGAPGGPALDPIVDEKIVKNSHNVIHLVPFLSGYRCPDTDMETWNRVLRPTTADADKQFLANFTYFDSFEFCVPSAEHRYELHMDI